MQIIMNMLKRRERGKGAAYHDGKGQRGGKEEGEEEERLARRGVELDEASGGQEEAAVAARQPIEKATGKGIKPYPSRCQCMGALLVPLR